MGAWSLQMDPRSLKYCWIIFAQHISRFRLNNRCLHIFLTLELDHPIMQFVAFSSNKSIIAFSHSQLLGEPWQLAVTKVCPAFCSSPPSWLCLSLRFLIKEFFFYKLALLSDEPPLCTSAGWSPLLSGVLLVTTELAERFFLPIRPIPGGAEHLFCCPNVFRAVYKQNKIK